MRLDRLVVPLGAAVVIAGLVIVVVVVARSGPGGPRPPQTAQTDLLAMKAEAEKLAIAGKLPEAHAKYRELFEVASTRTIRDSLVWDNLERARVDQDRIYGILLNRHDPAVQGIPMTIPVYPPYPRFEGAEARSATAPWPGASSRTSAATMNPTTGESPRVPATTRVASGTTAPTPETAPAGTTLPTTVASPAATGIDVTPVNLPQPRNIKVVRTSRDPDDFSDALLGQSIRQGAGFLIAQFENGQIKHGHDISDVYQEGLNALCVHALLAAGQATRDPRLQVTHPFMRELIDQMKRHTMSTDREKPQQPVVYARSLRAAALAMHNRPEDQKTLREDVEWLIGAHREGAYSYDDRFITRIIPGDPRREPRPKKEPATKPWPWEQDPRKPRRMIPDQVGSVAGPGWPGGATYFVVDGPVVAEGPIQLADGRHDPRTGRELDPPFRRNFPPSLPPRPIPPAQYPVEKTPQSFVWDNSNTQYGVMGVWSVAGLGMEVPDAYWAAVQQHWITCQLPDGQWGYRPDRPGGYLAMTCAGIASLLVTTDQLEAPAIARAGSRPQASPASQALDRALGWLETGNHVIEVTGPRTVYLGYTLHALSRVGLASGFKYLGNHEWYRDLARKIVLSQWENGSWGRSDQATADTCIDTAYTILFLARGRHPVMMNKLRLDTVTTDDAGNRVVTNARGAWDNRPRDLSNLARFTSRELERPVNWQIVPMDREPADWADSPIVYLASHQSLKLSDRDLAKLRTFAIDGGMIYTQADENSVVFNAWVEQLAEALFPGLKLEDLPGDHAIYMCQYQIAAGKRPKLRGVTNGSRLLWVHSPTDLAIHWQQAAMKTRREAFEMGVNLFVFAAGKVDLRNRLDDRIIPAPHFAPSRTIPLVRLRYGGDWNPEPSAFYQYAKWFHWETGLAIDVRTVEMAALKPGSAPIAHFGGITAYQPSAVEAAALRKYVEAGGVLLVEPVGGADGTFAAAMQSAVLPEIFAGAKFEALTGDDPLLKATFEGMDDVWPPRLRPFAANKLGEKILPIRVAKVGKGKVIYLPLDMTTGLLGSGAFPVLGYDVKEAQALMKNILLWEAENGDPGGGR